MSNELVIHDPFNAPVDTNLLDGLIKAYQHDTNRLQAVAAAVADAGSLMDLFQPVERSGRYSEPVYTLDHAMAGLNANYWDRALKLTDVLDCMPQARREEWFDSIRNRKAPAFESDTVRATLLELLGNRQRFLAERVDGIWRSLSHEHITNSPQGFGKRMILAHVTGYSSYGDRQQGAINDLRCVIARFMGMDEPSWYATRCVMDACNCDGSWHTIDGGAMRVRTYKKGTAHLEIHPDMAWRLNCILHGLHPLAIPSEFRQPPKVKAKEWPAIQRPLPHAVMAVINGLRAVRHERLTYTIDYSVSDKHLKAQAVEALIACGATYDQQGRVVWPFDPREVMQVLRTSGCIPDAASHQFYPTPESLADLVVQLADVQPGDSILEPSAGHGALALRLPRDQLQCVELSEMHAAILRGHGLAVDCADFLTWQAPRSYSLIAMNPPYSQGRWQAHIKRARELLKDGGRIVAVLPWGARGKVDGEWHGPFSFAGVSIEVGIVVTQ